MTTTDALDRARDWFARHAYARRVAVAAGRDPVVAGRFLRVASLQDPPPRLFRPSTARRVLLANLRRRSAPALRRPEIA
jgi:hypothetical protein